MPIKEYCQGVKPYKMVYVGGPFGVVIGIYSHSYESNFTCGFYQE